MIVPSQTDFDEWNAGQIGDVELARIEAFFADMLKGAEALGPRYSLAAMALRAEHNAALTMQNRRREPRNPYASVSLVGDAEPSILTALRN